ncbi:unnamed protein product [Owenia fusiformis]|uniref:SNF-related serine/threonine-protein kinase n=1 Tax=Owenia fusiformis TaxID=6347 RepID=A0A8S4NG43_OWEFU|nr:unnamed protein product [Owenia fusiformis]
MSFNKRGAGYDGKIAGLYDLHETIGRGHFAVVKLARHVFTNLQVAVKIIDKTKLDEVSKAHLFQEVTCMKLVQHPNVVRLYQVIDTPTKLYLILELGDGGDMYDYIMKHDGGLDEQIAKRYFKQIIQAVSYCHKLHVVHRDLKPENVVFFEKLGIVKLTDFGFSNKFIPGKELETSCGSLAYSAPEILLGDSYSAPAVDVWSLGVLLYMLVVGEAPFQEANDSETLTMIMDCKYRIPETMSPTCRSLIDKMLRREPEDRAKLDEIISDPWLMMGDASPVVIQPLISRQQINEESHKAIVQKMVERNIASKEDILNSIEKDKYDNITATYYLLAEQTLRKQQKHEQSSPRHNSPRQKSASPSDNKPKLEPLALSPRSETPPGVSPDSQRRITMMNSLVSPPGAMMANSSNNLGVPAGAGPGPAEHGFLGRKFSLIREEVEEDSDMDVENQEMKTSKSVEDCSDSDSRSSTDTDSRTTLQQIRSRTLPLTRPLHSVRSSPQLLNQITEAESEEEDDILPPKISPHRMLHSRATLASPEVLRKLTHQKKRLGKGSKHGTSCSSSDASDTDETDRRKRKEKIKQRFQRRDSSDHSSDTDGPAGAGGVGGGGRQFVSSHRSCRVSSSHANDSKTESKGGSSGGKQNGLGDNNSNNSVLNEVRNSSTEKNVELVRKDSNHSSTCSNGDLHRNDSSKKSKDGLSRKDSGKGSFRKTSNFSIASNISNLSLSSLASRGSRYIVDSCTGTPKGSFRGYYMTQDVETMNLENRYQTKVIHVRSKDFSDLQEKFRCKEDQGSVSDTGTYYVKLRKRQRNRSKTDVNRNSHSEKSDTEVALVRKPPQTKCCSLV